MAIEKYQLKNGKDRWKVRVYAGKNPQTGQEIRIKRSGFTTYREAKLEESRILASYDIEKHLEESNTAYKFEEVTDLWLSQYKNTVKENTFKSAQELIERKITPVFGNYYIDKIPLRLCQNSVNEWYKTYTRSSLIVSYFNRIVDFAISLGYCTDNPMKRTIRPKNTHRKEYDAPFYSKDELQLLFEKTLESEDYIYYVMYRVLAFTGLRRGELLGLKWSDIDFDKQLMTISRVLAIGIDGPVLQTPKTKSSRRTLSVDSETLKVMQMWKAMQLKRFLMHGTKYDKNDYLVFTDEKNHAIRIDRPGKVLQRIITRYDLKYIHLHGFRHTHCSLLFEAGIEMQDVKDRLGHSDIATTMNIYTHVSPEKRDHIANVFSDFMKIN